MNEVPNLESASQLIDFLRIMDIQAWLIGIFGATLGVILGHLLTMRMYSKRGDALEKGLYNELDLVKGYFQSWLKELVDEINHPVRASFSGYTPVDMSCIDSLITELIAVNRLLTKDQRALILNLKSKFKNLEAKDRQRDDASTWNEEKGSFIISAPCTARLLLDSVEVVYYLSEFIEKKGSFILSPDTPWEERGKEAFSEAGIEFSPNLWSRVSRYTFENS